MRQFTIFALLLATACATTTTPPPAEPQPQPVAAAAPAPQPEPAPAETADTRPRGVILPARGLSCNSAIVLKATSEQAGIAEEHAWIQENYPGAQVPVQQSLTKCGDKPVDKIEIETANGRKVSIYFDISNFFGKP
ncbi:MAG: hypothetical protein QOE82_1888 [Thermoanaerobaculia bacterium]|nr:hypothetical protein [Thermoanaerobaculia bacterium]